MDPINLLVLDDSKTQCLELKNHLENQYSIVEAHNVTQAIEILKRIPNIQGIFMEMGKGNSNGLEILKFIQEQKLNIKKLAMASISPSEIEEGALALGIDYIMEKPLNMGALSNLLKNWFIYDNSNIGNGSHDPQEVQIIQHEKIEAPIKQTSDNHKLPFQTTSVCCYICGYNQVKFHKRIEGRYEENWNIGLLPEYTSIGDVQEFDLLKCEITVCPYCFFASSKIEDFAEHANSPFPYHIDAKRILSRSIFSRRKLLSEAKEIDERFDDPNRNISNLIDSLRLADKCMNGLILGGKKGAYFQIGIYQFLLGSLQKKNRESYYRSSIDKFETQIKEKDRDELNVIRSIYFIMAANMAMSNSDFAKEKFQWLKDRYLEKNMDDLDPEIKLWFERIEYIWQNGVMIEYDRQL